MYRIIVRRPAFNDNPVTDTDGSLVPGQLQLAYELSLKWFEDKKCLPQKPEDMPQEEWEKTGWDEALAKLASKTVAPKENQKICGYIDIALLDSQAHEFLNYLNMPAMLIRVGINRHSRRGDETLFRRQERYDSGLEKIKEQRKLISAAKKTQQAKKAVRIAKTGKN